MFFLTLFFILITILPLSKSQVWWIRGFAFPRLQFAIAGLLILIVQFIFLDLSTVLAWAQIIAVLCCEIYQLIWILPYTRLTPQEVQLYTGTTKEPSIKLVSANVLTPNRNSQALIELIKANQPDIIVTLETDSWWQSQLKVLETDYPYTIQHPLDNLYGMHVYSKLKLNDSSINFLVEDDVPSMHTCAELSSGVPVSIHFLHPAPPSPTENEESQERDAELLVVAKSIADYDGPVIVAGDLNDVAWSKTTRLFRKISGLLDPRIGRGMFNTFNAQHWFLRWPLDHLFHSDHFKLKQLRRLPGFGSDHFALFSELVYVGSKGKDQEEINTDPDDHSEAQEMINKEDVDKHDVPNPAKS